MSEHWWCGLREDGGSWTGPFDSRAEAVEEVLADIRDDPNHEIGYVGRSGPLPYGKLICATQLLERLVTDVCSELDSEHPEYEDWLAGVTKDQEEALDAALNSAMDTWMTENGYSLPSVIVDVERIEKQP